MARKLRIEGFSIYDGDVAVGSAVTIADRELFAASPLMLEALEDARNFIHENTPHEYGVSGEYKEITERIKAAIAAAKGE